MERFLNELQAYDYLRRAGLRVPRHGRIEDHATQPLPFQPGEPIVLKGIADQLWHKSDAGALHFGDFDPVALVVKAAEMRAGVEPKHPWIGGMVCEKVAFQRLQGLPTEALVSLKRTPDAGWLVIMGLGGVQTEAWAELEGPMIWPVAFTSPEAALEDLKKHWLGRVWLGTLRGSKPLTDTSKLLAYLQSLWKAVELLETDGVTLLEINPVALDAEGLPCALDGVGTFEDAAKPLAHALDPHWLEHLFRPKRVALAGVSAKEGTVGRIILENLLKSRIPKENILIVKPGVEEFLGQPCLPNVEALKANPVDLLILSLPATATIEAVEALVRQGGGAPVVYLVAGGLGDGGDTQGHGRKLMAHLEGQRASGNWTPALVGPNGLGFLCSELHLNTLFIPEEKLPIQHREGSLAFVSQSGAFLITRMSKQATLPLKVACAFGNQMDAKLSDFLRGFALDEGIRCVAAYMEGFSAGDLQEAARAARELKALNKSVLLYKGGRSAAGAAAASSHTGSMAGDFAQQKNVLKRAGVLVAESMQAFESALMWLSAYGSASPRRVAVMTNAGYESVASADLIEAPLSTVHGTPDELAQLAQIIEANQLTGLVGAHLPLDLTPMADEKAYLDCARLLAQGEAEVLIVGLVPLTKRLETWNPEQGRAFAESLAAIARESGRWLGVTVESGELYEPYRKLLAEAGLPVFMSMEEAVEGLKLIAS